MTQPDQLTPPGSSNGGSFAEFAAKTEDQWREEQRGKVAKSTDKARAGFSNIGRDTSKILTNITEAFFGWVGDLPKHEDSAQALEDQAAATAELSAAIAALQNNQNNAAVGGQAEVIDFSLRANSGSLGSDFTQTYSESGTGVWGVVSGRAAWIPVNDAPRTCVAVYNDEETATDYQIVGASFATSPYWLNSTAQARNRLFGRMNAAGTSYVFADFGKYDVILGCVVSGVKTTFNATGISFKANALYWLVCGTVGGLRVFQVLEGTKPVITHTEVGTTSQVGSSYRYCGAGVRAYATAFGTGSPGKMPSWAFSDNQPPTVYGSTGHMERADTAVFNVSAGNNLMPSNTFDTPGETSSDITVDLTTGKFTVTYPGQYLVEAHVAIDADLPSQLQLRAYVNGVADRLMGDPIKRGLTAGGAAMVPDWGYGAVSLQLEADDYVQLGYYASSATIGGCITGEASGFHTFFTISLQSRSFA